MKRTFIAIRIEPGKALLECMAQLKSTFFKESVNWTAPFNLHITLAFLGDTADDQLEAVNSQIALVAASNQSFITCMAGFGIFNANRKPKVFWVGIQQFEQLEKMKLELESRLDQLGFKPDPRTFRPHLTLGRIRHLEDRIRLQQFIEDHENIVFQDVPVKELVYFESVLTPKGPIYKVIGTYSFGFESSTPSGLC